MFEGIPCSKCDGLLIVDELLTLELYDKQDKYEIKDVLTVTEEAINKDIGFRCVKCKNEEHINYKEWELRARKHITTKLLHQRAFKLLAASRARGLDEDNGISYCGGCFGYGGDGWCLNDIINQCELGKTINEL